jgi:hypothetical protein
MKKSFVFMLIFLIVPLVSALQINMKSNYSQSETLIAQIPGNFISQIQPQNVLLYQGHVRVSFISNVQKADDVYYIYGQLGNKPLGNYTLDISGVTYIEAGTTQNSDIVQNFTITNSSADFSIDSGFIDSSSGNFVINAQNLLGNSINVQSFIQNSTITNTTNSSNTGILSSLFGGSSSSNYQLTSSTTTNIAPGITTPIPFSVNSSNQDQLLYAVLQTNNTIYLVPVFIPANSTQENFQSIFTFQPSQETISSMTNSNVSSVLNFYNSGPQIQNVTLSVSNNLLSYVFLPTQVTVDSNSTVQIPFNVTSGSGNNFIQGQITASSQNLTASFALTLNFSQSYTPPSSSNASLFQTCSQLNGIFCNDNQTCNGQTQNAEDGICCIGSCQLIQNSSGTTIIIWLVIALIVIIAVFLLIRKYRKTKRPVNLLDIANKNPRL